jgi:hypothetical protein
VLVPLALVPLCRSAARRAAPLGPSRDAAPLVPLVLVSRVCATPAPPRRRSAAPLVLVPLGCATSAPLVLPPAAHAACTAARDGPPRCAAACGRPMASGGAGWLSGAWLP